MTTLHKDEYTSFLENKAKFAQLIGMEVLPTSFHPRLFEFQKDTVRWCLAKGRAAVFYECGLGKTIMELEIAQQIACITERKVLIVAPLAVSQQTVREGAKFGYEVHYSPDGNTHAWPISITNYERLHLFNLSDFECLILDESSILKSYTGRTTQELIERSAVVPYRFAFTATPAPNDHEELGNHAEFLGIMTRTEMLATYFVHDVQDSVKWRLKGHAQDLFWKWVATWGVAMRNPADLGYSGDGYNLPKLSFKEHRLELIDGVTETLFATEALTMTDQRRAKRSSLTARVERVAALVAAEPDESWVIWCELNDEGNALHQAIPGSVQVAGADTQEHKERAMLGFADGSIRVLISKSKICGFGMNWQHCARVAFVGVSHSYESTYQAIRRCWRFGQTRPVTVHLVYGEAEAAIVRNLERKQSDADRMNTGMRNAMQTFSQLNTQATRRETEAYAPCLPMQVPYWIGT
jgi:superfamily II DNA or RNA helicase